MAITDLLLVRHGATEWSRDDLFCGSSDIDLAPEGYAQAERLARRLAREPIRAVYSSPMRRTLATARILGAPHSLTPVPVPGLREMDFGAWEGRRRDEIKATDGSRYAAWQRDPATVTPEGGEGAYAVAARVVAALAPISERHQGSTVLVVAHKTVNRILLCHFLGLPIAAYRDHIAQEVCALNRVAIGAERQARVILLGDTAHTLPDG